jgi:hypothetical protein
MMELTSSSEPASEYHQVSSWKAPNSSILSLRVPARSNQNPQQKLSNMITYQIRPQAGSSKKSRGLLHSEV